MTTRRRSALDCGGTWTVSFPLERWCSASVAGFSTRSIPGTTGRCRAIFLGLHRVPGVDAGLREFRSGAGIACSHGEHGSWLLCRAGAAGRGGRAHGNAGLRQQDLLHYRMCSPPWGRSLRAADCPPWPRPHAGAAAGKEKVHWENKNPPRDARRISFTWTKKGSRCFQLYLLADLATTYSPAS